MRYHNDGMALASSQPQDDDMDGFDGGNGGNSGNGGNGGGNGGNGGGRGVLSAVAGATGRLSSLLLSLLEILVGYVRRTATSHLVYHHDGYTYADRAIRTAALFHVHGMATNLQQFMRHT